MKKDLNWGLFYMKSMFLRNFSLKNRLIAYFTAISASAALSIWTE
jgi:hypothetical protein